MPSATDRAGAFEFRSRDLWIARMPSTRRGFVQATLGGIAALRRLPAFAGSARRSEVLTLVTFGDSILDCARYNHRGVDPGGLLVRNDDRLFPRFAGCDLSSCRPTALDHRARDGSRVDDLARQARNLAVHGPCVVLITIGGNDLLGGLAADAGGGMARFASTLDAFLRTLPVRPVLLGNVYDPTFGDDSRNFLNIDARIARDNLSRINTVIADLADRHGHLVDLHAHFRKGDESWFASTIEPSLRGASEVRAAFLPGVLELADCARRVR
jgi:acyl-CoA thioesterase I